MNEPKTTDSQRNDLRHLLEFAETLADDQTDGHLTLMRFTTGWKVVVGTPSLGAEGRDEVSNLKQYPSLGEALASLAKEANQQG
jgi:hypothetical protein